MATPWDTLAPTYIKRLAADVNITPEQAAGIFGQLGHESAGLQAINEYKPVVPGSRGGFGWAQWTGPRRRQFESWASQNKADVSDPETNYQFLLHELTQTPEGRVLADIRSAPDAITAGRVFTDRFLRPGVPAYESRDSWTQKALDLVLPTAQAGTLPENQEMNISDRIQRARDAGFNDEEILQRIQSNADMAKRIQRARDAGFSDEEIFGRMGLSMGGQQAAEVEQQTQPQERSFVESMGDSLREIPRQAGLTARYGMEGLGQAAGVLTEPIRQGLNMGLRAAGLPEAAPTAAVMSSAADALGLPTPQTANERVVGDVTRLMAGAGGVAGTSNMLARGATGATQGVLNTLGSNPGSQVASAMGAGAAGGSVRESGGGPVAQGVAALAGGLAAPAALSGAQSVARSVQGRLAAMRPEQLDDAIAHSLQQAGIDWRQVPERVRQQLRQEAGQALRSGNDLDPTAMARLADFRRIEGATPTRGMLTQDPGQVTREMNLAKQQATTGASGTRNLSQLQAGNNAALVRALNTMGADSADDAVSAGQRAIDALQARIGSRQARINDLYGLARDSAGRSFPLNGAAFTQRAGQLLDDNLVAGSLPADVRNHLNRIAQGEVPFTVDYAEQLKTMMGRLQRNTSDGSARYALGLVRQALDDTPVMPLGGQTAAAGARAVNPGNLPAVADDATLGAEAIAAFNQARSANRSLMRQIERTPALKDLYEGRIAPDNFTQKYVIGSGAKASDVQRLGRMLAAEPQAKNAVRTSITQYLKDRALSGQPDDIGAAKFSAAQYAKALKQIGDRKLSAFFDPQEIEQLHAISRVGRLMTNQPIGSAVNNSNTSAALVGRALDMLGTAGRNFRLLGIGEQVGAVQSGLQQRAAQRIGPSLALPPPQSTPGSRLIPASLYGSLLAAPGVPRREDQRSP